jgi:hypothetical protein
MNIVLTGSLGNISKPLAQLLFRMPLIKAGLLCHPQKIFLTNFAL